MKKIILFFLTVILASCAIAQEVKFDRFVDLKIVPVGVVKGDTVPVGKATAWQINGKLYFTTASHVIQQESFVEIHSLDGKKFYGWARIIGNVDSLGICAFGLDTTKMKANQQSFIEPVGSFKTHSFSVDLSHLGVEIISKATSSACVHYFARKVDSKFNLDKGDSGISDIGWDEETGEWYIFVFQRKVHLSKSGTVLGFTRMSINQLVELLNRSAY